MLRMLVDNEITQTKVALRFIICNRSPPLKITFLRESKFSGVEKQEEKNKIDS